MTVKFESTAADSAVIDSIVRRAIHLVVDYGIEGSGFNRLSLTMDLLACHNESPLNLQALLEADNGNFSHDVFGIVRHLDRDSGTLRDCFVPRFTL